MQMSEVLFVLSINIVSVSKCVKTPDSDCCVCTALYTALYMSYLVNLLGYQLVRGSTS